MKVLRFLLLGLAICLASGVRAQAYQDVKAFDLKGNVRFCEVREIHAIDAIGLNFSELAEGGTVTDKYSFSSDGKYIPNTGENVIYEGRVIKKIQIGDDERIYDFSEGRLKSIVIPGFLFMAVYSYTYGDNGVMIEEEFDSNVGHYVKKYSNYEFDSKGNWIQRISKVDDKLPVGEIRTITYY